MLVKSFLPPYLAREAMRLPILAALTGIVVCIVLTWLLLPRLGAVAAPLGVAASAWVNALILAGGLLRESGSLLDAAARVTLPRILLATAATASATYLMQSAMAGWMATTAPFGLRVACLAAISIAGVLVHMLAAHAFGAADLAALQMRLPVA